MLGFRAAGGGALVIQWLPRGRPWSRSVEVPPRNLAFGSPLPESALPSRTSTTSSGVHSSIVDRFTVQFTNLRTVSTTYEFRLFACNGANSCGWWPDPSRTVRGRTLVPTAMVTASPGWPSRPRNVRVTTRSVDLTALRVRREPGDDLATSRVATVRGLQTCYRTTLPAYADTTPGDNQTTTFTPARSHLRQRSGRRQPRRQPRTGQALPEPPGRQGHPPRRRPQLGHRYRHHHLVRRDLELGG